MSQLRRIELGDAHKMIAVILKRRRSKEVKIPVSDPERAVRILLQSCEQRDLIKLFSELGFTLHRIGAVTCHIEVIRTWLSRKGIV
jgi:hypothetical protein